MQGKQQIAMEDTFIRPPEWEPIETDPGQPPTMRSFEWDPVHGYYKSTGPKIQTKRPLRPA